MALLSRKLTEMNTPGWQYYTNEYWLGYYQWGRYSSPLNNAKGFITRNQGLLIKAATLISLPVQIISASGLIMAFWKYRKPYSGQWRCIICWREHAQITSTGGDIVAVDGEAALSWGRARHWTWQGVAWERSRSEKCAWHPAGYRGCGAGYWGAKINVNAAGAVGHGIENRAKLKAFS